MYCLKLFDRVYCFDFALGLTFVYHALKWSISNIPFHEIESMNLGPIEYLTFNEMLLYTDGKSLRKIRKKLLNLYKELVYVEL